MTRREPKNDAPRVPFDTRRIPFFWIVVVPATALLSQTFATVRETRSQKALREISCSGVPEHERVSGRFPFRRSLATGHDSNRRPFLPPPVFRSLNPKTCVHAGP